MCGPQPGGPWSAIDREALRGALRATSDDVRRLVLERVVEELPDEWLRRVARGLVPRQERAQQGAHHHPPPPKGGADSSDAGTVTREGGSSANPSSHRTSGGPSAAPAGAHDAPTPTQPTLAERAAAHAAATRRGDFLGDLVLRNRHGERVPWQTKAWLAATSHLFDLALERAREHADPDGHRALSILVELAEEVDERPDELVTWEDDESTSWLLGEELRQAKALLARLDRTAPR